jgi:predicted kinase
MAGAPAVALVLLPPADAVHARNLRRTERSVPADVVDRQLAAAAALGGDEAAIRVRLRREGFAAVHVWFGAEAEDAAVDVVLRPRAKGPGRATDPVRPPG